MHERFPRFLSEYTVYIASIRKKTEKMPLEMNLELFRKILVITSAMPYYFLVKCAQAE
tara:strand:+ start:32279 stop:32452 length:174 start_codon:yes stop_codon:yes gene_type:complete